MKIGRLWLWDRSGFMLAVCVLTGLVLGWGLPATENLVWPIAIAQIIMAIVVVIKEGPTIAAK